MNSSQPAQRILVIDAESHTHYLRVFMMRLRKKLEDTPDAPKYFQTESGIGYRLVTGAL